jgi:DNA-binding beta-propeller fold protein YncE
VLEARGVALTADEQTLYVVGRFPDTLLQISVVDPRGPEPKLSVVRAVPLPSGATQVSILSRPGRGNLVFVSCSTANLVSVYDEDVGKIVREYTGVGDAPYAMVFQRNGAGARMFVSSFGSGSVAVVDIPDLVTPDSIVVGHIGQTHECTLSEGAGGCGQ